MECVGGTAERIPAVDFFSGYRTTAITGTGALVTGICIPKQRGTGQFIKLGARRYLVISIAMASAAIDLDASGTIRSAAIAVGACSAVAQRLPGLEAALLGRRPDPALVLAEHLAALTPLDDVRATVDYRRAAALQIVRDLVGHYATVAQRAA